MERDEPFLMMEGKVLGCPSDEFMIKLGNPLHKVPQGFAFDL